MDDQIDIRFVKLETKFDIMQKYHNLNGDSLGQHLEWILELKDKQDKQVEYNANVVKRLQELEDYTATYSEKHQTNKNYSFQRRIEELEDYRVKIYLKLERHDDIVVVHRSQLDGLRKEINEMKRVMNDYLMINLDNPEYITKVHEKRGNHGTGKTKKKKPK